MQHDLERKRWRFSLLTLLLLPVCFVLGWFAREWTFEHDVNVAAERIIKHSNGTVIPELGLIVGGAELTDRKLEIENEPADVTRMRDEMLDRLRVLNSDGSRRETATDIPETNK